MVKIISDSTCDLNKELIEKYNISILPLHVRLEDEEFLDGVNISRDEIFAWSDANKKTPKTSAPSLEDAIELFEKNLAQYDEIVAFSISSQMSTSCEVMRIAADSLEAEDRIRVIDSRNLSTGIGHLVVEAAVMAANGADAKEIVTTIQALIPRVRASFVVDTLVYLHRGGRCSSVAAIAGSALKLHPKIEVADGAMSAGKKYRGKYADIVLHYVKDMEDALRSAKRDRVFITHSGMAPGIVELVRGYLEELGCFDEIIETNAGGVISSHCGPGTLGVLFIAGE